MASFVVAVAAMYLASMLERVTLDCFFDDQLMAVPAKMNTKPVTDLWLLTSAAQSAST